MSYSKVWLRLHDRGHLLTSAHFYLPWQHLPLTPPTLCGCGIQCHCPAKPGCTGVHLSPHRSHPLTSSRRLTQCLCTSMLLVR